jgi:hypothetical protein
VQAGSDGLTERRRARRRWTLRLALLAAGLAAAGLVLVAAELLVRLCCPWINLEGLDASLFAGRDPEAGHEWRPGAEGLCFGVRVQIDALGCRRLDRSVRSGPAWLILGDSVAFGVGVPAEQTFAGLLQREHPQVRILNSAVVSMDLAGYVRTARRLLGAVPEIRRVTLFLTLNDVPWGRPATGAARTEPAETGPAERRLPSQEVSGPLRRLVELLRPRSKLYRLVKSLCLDSGRAYFEYDLQRFTREAPAAGERFRDVGALAELTAAAGLELEVVLMPYEFQLRADTPEVWVPQQQLAAYLRGRGVRFVDARAWLDGTRGRPAEHFLYGDPMHLSPHGHAAVFRHLDRWETEDRRRK